MWDVYLAFLLAVIYFILPEIVFRTPQAKDKTQKSKFESRTTLVCLIWNVLCNALPLVSCAFPWLFNFYPSVSSFILPNPFFRFFSLGLMVFALALRCYSMKVLGDSFSRVLKIQQNHTVVNTGPYALIRHPGYLANLLSHLGESFLIATDLSVPLIVLITFGAVYGYRTRHEEAMLIENFGEQYKEYQARTKKFIPYLI